MISRNRVMISPDKWRECSRESAFKTGLKILKPREQDEFQLIASEIIQYRDFTAVSAILLRPFCFDTYSFGCGFN